MQRLKGRSAHELYTRASQQAYSWSERASLRLRPTGGDSRMHMFALGAPAFGQPFFSGISNASATVAALRAMVPLNEAEVLAAATRIEQGEIPLLGYGHVHIGQAPQWQRDPFAGLTAPQRHWSTIPYLNPEVVGDHKIVWEISRHQYFVTLGQAWAYTQNPQWPRTFKRLLLSWLDNNPATVGMNWASSLEVSYRAISWLWALQLMRDADGIDSEFKSRVLNSLQMHGRHLQRYLSTYFSPNTHLTGEALGLYYIGTQCPDLPQAKAWADTGAAVLESALAKQVLPDGVYFEQASQYHRYTIDIYLHYVLLARAAGKSVGANVLPALNKLFDVLLHLTRGDGSIALVGDDDGGRLVQLDNRQPHDVRALLATGAVVLNRSDLAWVGRGDDAALCWMLGKDASTTRDSLVHQPPSEHARAFSSGGIFTMRDGWDAHDAHMVIDAGAHGGLSYGHSHADALAVELFAGGEPLFVDAGTYTYVGAERDAFRTTAAHNTVEIDATSASLPGAAFRWKTVTHANATGWTSEREFSYFCGAHDGYASLPSPLRHERSVLHAAPGLFVILDALKTEGAHSAVLRWHCAPALTATLVNDSGHNTAAEPGPASAVEIRRHAVAQPGRQNGPQAHDKGTLGRQDAHQIASMAVFGGLSGKLSIESGWVSPQFGQKLPANVCTWRESLNGNATLASIVMDAAHGVISWSATAEHRERVPGAAALLTVNLTTASSPVQMLVLVGSGKAITFDGVQLDADIACIRLDGITGKPVGLTAVGVAHASFNGAILVASGSRGRWVVASNLGAGAVDAPHTLPQVRSGIIARPDSRPSSVQSGFTSPILSPV